RSVAESSRSPASPRISFRVAVHLGDVYTTEDDIYGDGVNVAARLQEHADVGGIVLSEAVYDLVRGSIGSDVIDLGLLELKNIERPLRAFALAPVAEHAIAPTRARQSAVPSIAVLPLLNVGDNSDDVYFAEGVIEDIIVSLAGLRELLVIARSS